MSFDNYESSLEDGRPIHLYRFRMGATEWRYTSADHDLVIGGQTWIAVPITDDGIRETGEAATDVTTIEAPSSIGPAQVYMGSPPATPIIVHRLALHVGMTVPIINYTGELFQVNFPRPGFAKIVSQKFSATMQRNGLRLGWQRTCPYALYDAMTCRLNKTGFAVSLSVVSVDGYDVTVSGITTQPDGYFTGGFVDWSHPVRGAMSVMIESSVGSRLSIFGDTQDLYPGLPMTAYPGCARTEAACQSLGNILNYGGFKAMPGKSPYDGNPVF